MKKQSYALAQLVHSALIAFLSFLALILILALFTTLAHSAEVTLAWEPNTEPDLAGYRVYYKEASSGLHLTMAQGLLKGTRGLMSEM